MGKDVIIACDFPSRTELMEFLTHFEGENPYLKIGMEMFYREGPSIVTELKEKGCRIFLDLKLHDIPHTVYSAMKNLAILGVDITNVHASGGVAMMEAAVKGLEEGSAGRKRPELIAVTQLTSTSQTVLEEELLITTPMAETVKHYALNAKKAGLDGVVCSPLEAPIIKELGLQSITPGIRFAGDSVGDQKRIATPAYAKELGSTYIVVGRSITGASDPLAAYKKAMAEFCS
ncbi:MAG: orotidine-5'-phosphate decarboxylase [Bacillota bacterium]